jgi:hypothetical protein
LVPCQELIVVRRRPLGGWWRPHRPRSTVHTGRNLTCTTRRPGRNGTRGPAGRGENARTGDRALEHLSLVFGLAEKIVARTRHDFLIQ